jgi:imidazolonepropionase-like amidohydrolase
LLLAIQGGRIYTMSSTGILENGTILVEQERIVDIGNEVNIPPGCEIIDARNKHVCPGIIDAHSHLGLCEEIYRVEGDDLNEDIEPVSPQLQAVDGINFWDIGFQDALRGGVTRVQVVPGSANIIGGQAVLLKTLASNPSGMVYRNPWGVKAALGENPKRVYGGKRKTPRTRMANAALLREALFAAARLGNNEQLDAAGEFRLRPLYRVLCREMPLLVHAHRADDILTALRIKDEFNIDMVIQHGTEAFLVAEELARREVKVAMGPLLVNRAKVEMQKVSFKNAKRLQEAGVDFCFITDHPVVPIQHLRICAALAVREGLGEAEALKAITSSAAAILGVDDELGSIEKGKRADLVIFSHHPLETQSRVEMTMVDGIRWRD